MNNNSFIKQFEFSVKTLEDMRGVIIMKRFFAILLIMSMTLALMACSKAEEVVVKEKVRAVKVKEMQETENPVTMSYIGTVDSKDIVKYGFKGSGKLGRVFVEKGDKVKKDDKLAQLNMKDLNFQLSGSKASLNTAQLNIKKAKDALSYDTDLLNKMENLYKEGSISKDQYDKTKLKFDMSQNTYNQAKSQYDAAKTDYEFKLSAINDATIYANKDGIIVELLYEEGEVASGEQPVVVVRAASQIVNVGIAQKDLKKIKIGTLAIIDVDGEKGNAVVTNIAEAPDKDTRTYNAELTVEDKTYRLGSIANVSFDIGNKKAIWIPLTTIYSDGEEYVYIIKKDRAFKRTIVSGQIYDDHIMVEEGIEAGEILVVNGMKNLSDGIKVKIQE